MPNLRDQIKNMTEQGTDLDAAAQMVGQRYAEKVQKTEPLVAHAEYVFTPGICSRVEIRVTGFDDDDEVKMLSERLVADLNKSVVGTGDGAIATGRHDVGGTSGIIDIELNI